jgi:hypothetical protein
MGDSKGVLAVASGITRGRVAAVTIAGLAVWFTKEFITTWRYTLTLTDTLTLTHAYPSFYND